MHTHHNVLDHPSWHEHRRGSAPWRPPPVPTTVVVPHPDDEALMFAGLIQFQRRRGVDVHVIAVSDGEAAYPEIGPQHLAARRRAEQSASLHLLGVDAESVTRLELPDGDVGDHEEVIRTAIQHADNGLVVAPWIHDHHCDHEACGRAALAAAASAGTEVVGGMFWAWHHTPPEALTQPLLRLQLDAETRRSKHSATMCHASQLTADEPVLTPERLVPATWESEYYVSMATLRDRRLPKAGR